MYLQQLTLINFKNYTNADLSFSEGVNAFTGDNGAGKTNLLDAIHYLSLCKSYFNAIDSQQIKYGADFFLVSGLFIRDDQHDTVSVAVKRNQKKQFKRNKKEYQRLADHIGLFPLVMVSPYDASIIMEGSEERRRFMDNVISQTNHHYLDELISYNKILTNRNVLLRNMGESGRFDTGLLEIYDEQLVAAGNSLFDKRKTFMESFTGIFNRYYEFLSDNAELVKLTYTSQLFDQSFTQLLLQTTEKDRILQRTSTGIHRDDMEFTIHEMPLKKFGSQGQQKSFLIALKLAQYSYLQQQKGFKPLLLLDDIFDKLDEKRITKLMQLVSAQEFGQVFITDASTARVTGIFDKIGVAIKLFTIQGGEANAQSE